MDAEQNNKLNTKQNNKKQSITISYKTEQQNTTETEQINTKQNLYKNYLQNKAYTAEWKLRELRLESLSETDRNGKKITKIWYVTTSVRKLCAGERAICVSKIVEAYR